MRMFRAFLPIFSVILTLYRSTKCSFVHPFEHRILYGSHPLDSLVNSGITQLLERFLYMRPIAICNAYMQSIRLRHTEVRFSFLPSFLPRLLILLVRLTVLFSRNPEST